MMKLSFWMLLWALGASYVPLSPNLTPRRVRVSSDKDFYTEQPTKEDEEALIAAVDKKWAEIQAEKQEIPWQEVTEEERLDDKDIDLSQIPEDLRQAARLLPEDEQLAFLNKEMIGRIYDEKRAELKEWKIEFDKQQAVEREETKKRIFGDMAAGAQRYRDELDKGLIDSGLFSADEIATATAALKTEPSSEEVKPKKKVVAAWPPGKEAKIGVLSSGSSKKIPTEVMLQELKNLGYPNVVEMLGDDEKVTCAIVVTDEKFSSGVATVNTAIKRLEEKGCLVVASLQGASRSGNFDMAMKNLKTGGAYGRALETEDAAKLAVQKENKALSYVILRFGDLVNPGTKPLVVVPESQGEDPDVGPVSSSVAAKALAKVVVEPSALNATFALSGTTDGIPSAMWDDELLKLDGPELLRLETTKASSLKQLTSWLGEWANLFEDQRGTGLTTPVDISKTSLGATMTFVSPQTRREEKQNRIPKKPTEGGVDLVAEPSPTSSALRVRAIRTPYDPGFVVKAMSEEVILNKLQRDFMNQFG